MFPNKAPQYWHELYPEHCAGDVQSPIDIASEDTEATEIGPIVFNGYGSDDTPADASMQMINTGHSGSSRHHSVALRIRG